AIDQFLKHRLYSNKSVLLNATFEQPGDVVFKHACALGCEGIVSKRLGSRHRSGRCRDWLQVQEPSGAGGEAGGGRGLGKETNVTDEAPADLVDVFYADL